MLKIINKTVIALALLTIANSSYAQNVPLNIAIVDMNAVLGTASAPKSVRDQIKAIRDTYRKEVQSKEAGLRTANQELVKKQSLLSADAFQQERRKFEQQVLDVQKSVQQKNIELQNAQVTAQNTIKQALRDVVLQISQQKGYSLVLRREQTIVVADQLDITKDVIAALNQKLPSVKVSIK